MSNIKSIKDQFLHSFLKDVKKKVSKNEWTFAKEKSGEDRQKNIKFLSENGLSIDNVKEAILQLSDKDKAKGPEKDRDGYPGYIYKFKTEYLIEGTIYIKIRYNPPNEVVCISFHEDEQ